MKPVTRHLLNTWRNWAADRGVAIDAAELEGARVLFDDGEHMLIRVAIAEDGPVTLFVTYAGDWPTAIVQSFDGGTSIVLNHTC